MVTQSTSGVLKFRTPSHATFLSAVDVLILTAPLYRPPLELIAGLRKRDASYKLTCSVSQAMFAALRQLCRAIVIHDVSRFSQVTELRQALTLYVPAVQCWHSHFSGGKLQLELFDEPDGFETLIDSRNISQWQAARPDEAEATGEYQPGDVEGVFLRPTVTEEELDMLLGPLPEREDIEQRSRNKGG